MDTRLPTGISLSVPVGLPEILSTYTKGCPTSGSLLVGVVGAWRCTRISGRHHSDFFWVLSFCLSIPVPPEWSNSCIMATVSYASTVLQHDMGQYVCIYICICHHMCVYVYVYIFVYVYNMYVCIYKNVHTWRLLCSSFSGSEL